MSAVRQPEPTARVLTCTEAEYHADPCSTPSLNQSVARTLITKSPLHAWTEHPRLGNVPRETTVPKIEGTVIHALLLGKGGHEIEVLNFDNYRTKAAQVQRDTVIMEGRTPVLEHKYAEITTAADVIRKNLAEQGVVFEGGQAEVSIEWQEEGDEGPVLCRGRLDYLILEKNFALIYDPKKITSADEQTCMRSAEDYGLAIQRAAYVSAIEKLRPDLAGRVSFKFVFMEIEPPYFALPREGDGVFAWYGEERWHRAVTTWERCLRTNNWPGYPIVPLSVSPWALKREEELYEQRR
jgi:hypothetical protein